MGQLSLFHICQFGRNHISAGVCITSSLPSSPGSCQTPHLKYCRKEDDLFYHMVMTNTKTKTNTITKYTNTHTQHIVRFQKDPTCGIFLKRGLFKGIKNDIPMRQTRKYKNTNTQIYKYTNTN